MVTSGEFRPWVPLARVVEAFGPTLLRVVCGPAETTDVFDVVIHDPAEEAAGRAGDLVLAVGVRDIREMSRLAVEAGSRRVAAVVVKVEDRDLAALGAAVPDQGATVLALTPAASWSHVAGLVRTMLTAPAVPGEAVGDLFGLADAIASLLDAPVTIEDPSSRVLAFSNRQDQVDPGRRETILGRRVPNEYVKILEQRGVFRWLARETRPIWIEPLSESILPRLAVGIHAGDEVLGSIWVAAAERPTAQQESSLMDAAKVVALQLLRIRAEGDYVRRVQSELVATALEGGDTAPDAISRLGLGGGPFRVIASQPSGAEPEQMEAALQRLRQRLGVHSATFHPRSAVALVAGVVYVILGQEAASPVGRDPISEFSRTFLDGSPGLGAVLGISNPARSHRQLPRCRAEADQALRVLRHQSARAGESRSVARFAEVQAAALLLRLADLAASEGEDTDGPLASLVEYDATHHAGLVETLEAFLDGFGDVGAAAAALHIHPNTFRYRLRRANEISGLDLADPEERLAVMIQIRIKRIRESPDWTASQD